MADLTTVIPPHGYELSRLHLETTPIPSAGAEERASPGDHQTLGLITSTSARRPVFLQYIPQEIAAHNHRNSMVLRLSSRSVRRRKRVTCQRPIKPGAPSQASPTSIHCRYGTSQPVEAHQISNHSSRGRVSSRASTALRMRESRPVPMTGTSRAGCASNQAKAT